MERFEFVSTQDIDNRVRQGVPTSTRRANSFALHVYDVWVEARNARFPQDQFPPLEVLHDVPRELLSRVLSHFVFEIRRQDGKDYPPGTINGIMCGIMRHFRDECDRPDLNFFREENGFHQLRRCIDRRMQELTEKGVGLVKKQAAPLQISDEERL